MGLFDWLTGDDDNGGAPAQQVTYAQSPEQQQTYNALLPLLQRLGVATSGSRSNPYLGMYNRGVSPWTGRTTKTPTANRASLPMTSQAYPTASRSMYSPKTRAMANNNMTNQALAIVNKNRIAQGLPPVSLNK